MSAGEWPARARGTETAVVKKEDEDEVCGQQARLQQNQRFNQRRPGRLAAV